MHRSGDGEDGAAQHAIDLRIAVGKRKVRTRWKAAAIKAREWGKKEKERLEKWTNSNVFYGARPTRGRVPNDYFP